MIRRIVSVVICGALTLAACVGDDPLVAGNAPATSDAGAPPDAGPGGTDAATADAGSTCPAGFAECDGDPATTCETNVKTTAAHCGACGRSCGGAACTDGECAVETLHTGLDRPHALAEAPSTQGSARFVWYEGTSTTPMYIRGCRADDCNASTAILVDIVTPTVVADVIANRPRQIAVIGTKFYYSGCPQGTNTDCRVAECDVTGCKLTGPTYVTAADGRRKTPLVASGAPGSSVYTHQGLDGLYRTDVVGRTATGVSGMYQVGDQVQAIYADAAHFVYVDDDASQANPVGGVYVAPIAGGSRALLLPPPVLHLAAGAGSIFTSTGGSNAATASIQSCAITGCGQSGTVLATNQAYVSDIVADDKAVYWATVGAANITTNTAAVGTVMRCDLPSCAGGPVKIAEAVTNPVSLQLDDTYVTWLTLGTPGNKDGGIYRRRR